MESMSDCFGLPPREQDPAWKLQRPGQSRAQQIQAHENEWKANQAIWQYEAPPGAGFLERKRGEISTYITMLRGNFGSRFLGMLISVYFGIKGFLYPFATQGMLLYMKTTLGINGSQYQKFTGLAKAPWSMKAFFGALTDIVPLFGYNKISYITLASLLGGTAYVCLATIPLTEDSGSTAAGFFFLAHLELAIVDLLTEGKYAELMAVRPKTGGAVVSFVWGTYQIAGLLSSVIIGPMADAGYIQQMFWLAVPFALQVGLFCALGFFPETKSKSCIAFNRTLLGENQKFFVLAALMALGAIVMNVVNLFSTDIAVNNGLDEDQDWIVIMITTFLLAGGLCVASMQLLPRKIARCNLYMFISSALYVQIGGATDYYYLAKPDCVADGPNFDFTYYVSYSAIVGSIAGIIGVAMFQAVMGGWHFRPVFFVTTVLRTGAAVVDIVIVNRWNEAAGIPDKVMYMLGVNIIYEVTYMMEFMPGVVLTSKLCPKNIEATVYALLAGFSNFGQQVSNSIGIVFLKIFDVDIHDLEPTDMGMCNETLVDSASACAADKAVYMCAGDTMNSTATCTVPCKYDNLAMMIFVCHMVLPMCSIPFLYLLIPDIKMTDKLDEYDQDESEREELELQAPLVANSDGGSDDDAGLLRNPSD